MSYICLYTTRVLIYISAEVLQANGIAPAPTPPPQEVPEDVKPEIVELSDAEDEREEKILRVSSNLLRNSLFLSIFIETASIY